MHCTHDTDRLGHEADRGQLRWKDPIGMQFTVLSAGLRISQLRAQSTVSAVGVLGSERR